MVELKLTQKNHDTLLCDEKGLSVDFDKEYETFNTSDEIMLGLIPMLKKNRNK